MVICYSFWLKPTLFWHRQLLQAALYIGSARSRAPCCQIHLKSCEKGHVSLKLLHDKQLLWCKKVMPKAVNLHSNLSGQSRVQWREKKMTPVLHSSMCHIKQDHSEWRNEDPAGVQPLHWPCNFDLHLASTSTHFEHPPLPSNAVKSKKKLEDLVLDTTIWTKQVI